MVLRLNIEYHAFLRLQPAPYNREYSYVVVDMYPDILDP